MNTFWVNEFLSSGMDADTFIEHYLSFDLNKMNERYNRLFIFEGKTGDYPVFDLDHAIERLKERFPNLSYKTYLKVFKKGLRKIERIYNFSENHYVIISRKTRLKIPVDIRIDSKRIERLIVKTSTTLHADLHPENTHNDIEVMVEKHNYRRYPLMESKECENADWYYSFIEDNVLYKTYKIIEID